MWNWLGLRRTRYHQRWGEYSSKTLNQHHTNTSATSRFRLSTSGDDAGAEKVKNLPSSSSSSPFLLLLLWPSLTMRRRGLDNVRTVLLSIFHSFQLSSFPFIPSLNVRSVTVILFASSMVTHAYRSLTFVDEQNPYLMNTCAFELADASAQLPSYPILLFSSSLTLETNSIFPSSRPFIANIYRSFDPNPFLWRIYRPVMVTLRDLISM